MSKKSTFFRKIFTGYLSIIFILITVLSIISFRVIQRHYIKTLSGNLEKIGHSLESDFKNMLMAKKVKAIDDYTKNIANVINQGEKLGVRITVISPAGEVYGDSEEDPAKMDNHKDRQEVQTVIQKNTTGQSIRFSNTLNKEMLYIALPIRNDGEIISILRTSLFLEDINNLLGDLRSKIAYIAIAVTLLSVLISLFMAKGFTNPINKLNQAALEISKGDFNTQVEIKKEGELKQLADTFNNMTDRINRLFTRVDREREELDCILSSIFTGILVLNKHGRIKLANKRFGEYFGEDCEGKYIWEVLEKKDFYKHFSRLKDKKENFTKKIEWNDRKFLCSFSYASSKEEYIIVFNDITEIKQVEQIKKDFVSNVTHELRTPLTALKGFVETLEFEETDQTKRRYLGIIHRHTDRLINIVEDLLTLSKLERDSEIIEKNEVDFQEMMDNFNKILETKAREKGLDYIVNIEPNLNFRGDGFKIGQMIMNLMDNAIKYTDEGKVQLDIVQADNNLNIKVMDTGIGIPEEDRKRIFERFFVVDKSRSRKSGGTGLGLSIVKHITLLHSGNISIDSKPGVGTNFQIELPMNKD